jgi:hypothetical protein
MQIYSQGPKIRADAAALRTILSVTKWFPIDITIRGEGTAFVLSSPSIQIPEPGLPELHPIELRRNIGVGNQAQPLRSVAFARQWFPETAFSLLVCTGDERSVAFRPGRRTSKVACAE